ncbi:MAG: hypothetical protein SFU25_11275 [Candidatus Caenarcaniphilales bacterium]|nr:hypothetical protein [Candidatus Caenarcaniphilales bacterium]
MPQNTSFNRILEHVLNEYSSVPVVQSKIKSYFAKNEAARKYLEVCEEEGWELRFDHLTVRTYVVEEAAKQYEGMGWRFSERVDYKNEGWWANVYRHSRLAPCFIDQSYDDAKDPIIKKWVDKFSDADFHHIAVSLPGGVEIEYAIEKLQSKGIKFPGKITGTQGSRLRQIFTQSESVNGIPFSVLELAQRGIDTETGKFYEGFITEQADSLMKDSVL